VGENKGWEKKKSSIDLLTTSEGRKGFSVPGSGKKKKISLQNVHETVTGKGKKKRGESLLCP